MVTPKRIILPEVREKHIREHPQRALYAYTRRDDVGVVARIRYDPNYSDATLKNATCARYTHKYFFLSQLHFEQLNFAVRHFAWAVHLSYEQFLDELEQFVASTINPAGTYIVNFTLFHDGKIEIAAEETEPIANLFVGLLDHLRITHQKPAETDEDSETFMVETEPLPVYIDTEFTMACKYTLFDLSEKEIYEEAALRVKRDYKLDDELGFEEFEVLLYNSVQYVMSTLDSVVAVFKDDAWYVPRPVSGGRLDPLRQVLVEEGIVREALFNVQRLGPGEDILLISAQEGIRRGMLLGALPEPLSRYSRNRKSKSKPTIPRHIQAQTAEAAAEQASEASRRAAGQGTSGIPGTSVLKLNPTRRR